MKANTVHQLFEMQDKVAIVTGATAGLGYDIAFALAEYGCKIVITSRTEEKAILEGAKHGIAKFKNDGNVIQTSIGFDNSGYANLAGKTVPVPLIANSINHGTSFMQKQPFLRKAFSQNQGAAVAAIEAGIKAREDELELD